MDEYKRVKRNNFINIIETVVMTIITLAIVYGFLNGNITLIFDINRLAVRLCNLNILLIIIRAVLLKRIKNKEVK